MAPAPVETVSAAESLWLDRAPGTGRGLHVPDAANGWTKARTLQGIRAGLDVAPPGARVVCGDLNTPSARARDRRRGFLCARLARAPAARARSGVGRGRARRPPRAPRPGLPGRVSLPPRLRISRAELDLAANLGSWRRLAPRPPVHVCRARAGGLWLPPLVAGRGPKRPLGAGGRHRPKQRAASAAVERGVRRRSYLTENRPRLSTPFGWARSSRHARSRAAGGRVR